MSAQPVKKPLELRLETKKLVIVEGQNEVDALRTRLGSEVQVFSAESKDKIAAFLLGLHNISGFKAQIQKVVLMLDNDDDPQLTRASGLKWLDKAELSVIGAVLTVPDEGVTGMLEDVLLKDNASPSELRCINDFFACMRDATANRKALTGKARLQAWLAANSPGDHLGRAVTKGNVTLGQEMNSLIARLNTALNQ